MKFQKTLLLVPLLLLASCDKPPTNLISGGEGNSSSLTIPDTSTVPPTSNEVPSTSSIDKPSTVPDSSTVPATSTAPAPSTSGKPDSTSSKPTTTTTPSNRPATNPDGSKTLDMPDQSYGVSDIAEWVNYDFTSPATFPSSFRSIYGNNFNQPDFYAESAGGGLKINKNENAKKGFQTGYFTPFVKLEVRINIGSMNNSGKKVNEKDPAMTIYGFDNNGLIVATELVDNFDKNKEGGYVRVYLRNINITYLEVRCTNLPYKGSQVYNYAISGLSLKGWIYE